VLVGTGTLSVRTRTLYFVPMMDDETGSSCLEKLNGRPLGQAPINLRQGQPKSGLLLLLLRLLPARGRVALKSPPS
jgi:hypothetical protein